MVDIVDTLSRVMLSNSKTGKKNHKDALEWIFT